MIKFFNFIKYLFMINKKVISYSSHGCMCQSKEFGSIGKIVGITYPRLCYGKMYYVVCILADKDGYIKDSYKSKYINIRSDSLYKMSGNMYYYISL